MYEHDVRPDDLRLDHDGAHRVPNALGEDTLHAIERALADLPCGQAGQRLFGVQDLHPVLAAEGPLGALAAAEMGAETRPVRAILFDKTPATNWALPWHQDRVIAVREQKPAPGFGPWSRKHGALHVAPPFHVLARMLTLRLHLDPAPADNAPLLIAPGSHRLGRVAEPDIPAAVARCGQLSCLAEAGDAWLYATPIIHASEAAERPSRRRVLQVDYAVGELPGGLEWLGV